MTQMESPKRKMQKRNDYQRHKLFRKIKRRRKAQAEADQQIAEKQLRRKLKLPKFGNGKTRTEHLINGKYPSGKELEKAIDNRQMDLIMANFNVANGYGADYYNAYKDLLGKAKQTNNNKDWQNVIDFENRIRNSLKHLPSVIPFAIGTKSNDYNSGKDIYIKPSKRGTFTKAAKQHGMSVQGFANRVLRNPSKYSAAMRKKANFARNASKWNK